MEDTCQKVWDFPADLKCTLWILGQRNDKSGQGAPFGRENTNQLEGGPYQMVGGVVQEHCDFGR